MYMSVLSGLKIFEILMKICQLTPNFSSFSAFWGNIFGHYIWNFSYTSKVKFLNKAHIYAPNDVSSTIVCMTIWLHAQFVMEMIIELHDGMDGSIAMAT